MFFRGLMVTLGLFCLCGIMFFTGVMVGRGTAPVHFDTQPFREKLEELAGRKERDHPPEKTKLAFYDELKKKVSTDFLLSEEALEKSNAGFSGSDASVVGATAVALSEGPVPMKQGLKARTRVPEPVTSPPPDAKLQARENTPPPGKIPENASERSTVFRSEGAYTIQIASYRQLVDAIQRMETLKVKGFIPHRALALVDGNVWHRVRVGTYSSGASAEKALKALEAKGIYGIIIQKE